MVLIRIPATIDISEDDDATNEIPLEQGYVPVAISMPDSWTTADLTIQAKDSDGNWQDVYDDAGNEVVISAAADRWIVLSPVGDFTGLSLIRFRSGTSASPVAQGADRTLHIALRAV